MMRSFCFENEIEARRFRLTFYSCYLASLVVLIQSKGAMSLFSGSAGIPMLRLSGWPVRAPSLGLLTNKSSGLQEKNVKLFLQNLVDFAPKWRVKLAAILATDSFFAVFSCLSLPFALHYPIDNTLPLFTLAASPQGHRHLPHRPEGQPLDRILLTFLL